MAEQCKWGHPTPRSSDRDRTGFCRQCRARVNAEQYRKRRAREQYMERMVEMMEGAIDN